MKRTALRRRQTSELPIAWHEAEYAALRDNAANTDDDLASEDIFDLEDEHAEVDMIVQRLIRGVS